MFPPVLGLSISQLSSHRVQDLVKDLGGTGRGEDGEGEAKVEAGQRAGRGGLRPVGIRRPEAPPRRGAVVEQRVAQLHGSSLSLSELPFETVLISWSTVLQFL